MEKARITLGGDPEFELVVDGKVAPAERFLGGNILLPWGEIGEDGSGDPIELRPKPAASPQALVRNVGKLLLSVPRTVGGVPSTVCEEYPIGGHVHIGGVPSEVQEDLVEVIDNLLGDLFRSLSAELRLDRGYGRRGDWRRKDWGFEYRTPPASLWSHPEVALVFLRAIEWVAEKFLADEDPLGDHAWPSVREGVERATQFVKAHGGKLHWGAWKAYIGEVDFRGADVNIFLSGEYDDAFFGDLRAMCLRLGIPFVKVAPLARQRGDYASGIPGYGELVEEGHLLYRPGGLLSLSWRFRNDPEFRRAEMPKLERAIARLLERVRDVEEADGGRLIKEVFTFIDDPLDPLCEGRCEEECPCEECGGEVAEGAERVGPRYYRFRPASDPVYCEGCGAEVTQEGAFYYDRNPYCGECFFAEHDFCFNCRAAVLRESAPVVDGAPYCRDCYGWFVSRGEVEG